MEGHFKITLLISLYTITCATLTPTMKELRTGALLLPEKIIGGVIDMVHSHKMKPTTQSPYQQVPQGYPQQYPQYQQWNGPGNFQNPGYSQYQGQYQGQTQYSSYAPQNGYQGSNNPNGGSFTGISGQMYPSNQGFSTVQGQNQGQYQSNYQQPTGQYQQTQQFQTQQGNGQYQGQSNGYYGQNGQATQVSPAFGSGQTGGGSQGFHVTGGSQVGSSEPGPTCVCQAWTKPQSQMMKDSPVAEKMEKIKESDE